PRGGGRERRNPAPPSRSTGGTATEVYDYLRLLWARIGKPFCRVCGAPVVRDTPESVVDTVVARSQVPEVSRLQVAFPVPPSARASHEALVENLLPLGFVRITPA